jgi:hypothetical protein
VPVFGVAVRVAVNTPPKGTFTITHWVSAIEMTFETPEDPSVGGAVFGLAHVAGPLYMVTVADAGPPVGFPAGAGAAKAAPRRARTGMKERCGAS